jgi:hypothetical protein
MDEAKSSSDYLCSSISVRTCTVTPPEMMTLIDPRTAVVVQIQILECKIYGWVSTHVVRLVPVGPESEERVI